MFSSAVIFSVYSTMYPLISASSALVVSGCAFTFAMSSLFVFAHSSLYVFRICDSFVFVSRGSCPYSSLFALIESITSFSICES